MYRWSSLAISIDNYRWNVSIEGKMRHPSWIEFCESWIELEPQLYRRQITWNSIDLQLNYLFMQTYTTIADSILVLQMYVVYF